VFVGLTLCGRRLLMQRNKIALFISTALIPVKGKAESRPPLDTLPGKKGTVFLLHKFTGRAIENLESLTNLQRGVWDVVVVHISRSLSPAEAPEIPEQIHMLVDAEYPGQSVVYVIDGLTDKLKESIEAYHPGSRVTKDADLLSDWVLNYLNTGYLFMGAE
jgi:hypothetical protein